MNQCTSSQLYESISHITDTAPYSLHYTEVPLGMESALYLHWHQEMEFLYLTGGQVLFHVEDRCFPLHAGEGIFIPPGLLHHATALGSEQVCFHAFVLAPGFILSPFDTHAYNTYLLPRLHNNLTFATPLKVDIPWQREILGHLQTIFATPALDELFLRGITLLLWNQLYLGQVAAVQPTSPLEALSQQLTPALRYIHEHYTDSLHLEALAAMIPLSEGEFCRAFKRLTGTSPFRYLVRYRILQSCTELKQTNKKITDIALSNGFNNISYYNRAFLKVMGMTPSQYRHNLPSSTISQN